MAAVRSNNSREVNFYNPAASLTRDGYVYVSYKEC